MQTTPHECFLACMEEIVETPVLPLQEEDDCVDVVHLRPQERVNRTNEPIVGVPVRQIPEDGVDVQSKQQERVQRALEPIADVQVPQINRDVVEVLPYLVPQIREDIAKNPPCPVPQVMEVIMKVTQRAPHERVQNRVVEQIAGV